MAQPPIKKVVKLRIKVPANVTVVTELVPVPAELAFTPARGTDLAAASLEMDLTTAKTSQWLTTGRRVGLTDCIACCVRG
ncbi:conserved hypothetical protein [Rubrivivax sp. A210]|uniref:hypothetical protein n=1 Tax=Rubrivivax sp. A210 TaxID=2772301 RepID=UPI00191AFA73|nr:hypothetical protein [Rubrivivax sp. A210]CAD5366164.1 conserved hypothetical protein [Rubrivivax sp. A210]